MDQSLHSHNNRGVFSAYASVWHTVVGQILLQVTSKSTNTLSSTKATLYISGLDASKYTNV